MALIKSFIIAFAMYSKIPMPKIDWEEKNMRYALCFFPFVGIAEGAMLFVCWKLLVFLGCTVNLSAAVLTVLPILITGGIHVDGFLDTCDALSSYQSRERKLEILKDSHTGAFAIIGAIVYFLLYFGGVSQLNTSLQWELLWISFVVSRTCSGLAIVYFKGAKKEGLMYAFSSTAQIRVTRVFLLLLALGCNLAWVWLEPWTGFGLVIAALVIMLYYKKMSYHQFGGITGDLAGFFLQICELAFLYVIALLG